MSRQPDDSPDDENGQSPDERPPGDQPPDQPQGGQPPDQPQGGQPPNQPQGGQPPNQPQGGQPPNQPQGGQPPNQPQGGQPPNQPQGGQPPNQPQGGQPPNQPQGGQPPNQPQGGQPQGGQPPNQPQGGQPQGGQPPNQPQGGQPQGQPRGQPQGGQPRGQAGQRQGQAGQVQTGLDIDTDYLQEWAVYVTALFGVGGFGLGVLWIIATTIDEPIFEVSTPTGAVESALAAPILATMLMVLAVAGVFLGAWFGRKLEGDDQEVFVIAGASVAAGSAVFFILVSLLISIGLDDASLSIGGVIINLILTALFVGATTAGGAAVTRNLAPRDL